MVKTTARTLKKNGKDIEHDDQEQGTITHDQTRSSRVTVGAERVYNVGNYESVRIKIEYSEACAPTEKRSTARKFARILPADIDHAFESFCEQQGIKLP